MLSGMHIRGKGERGASAVEYGLLVALVGMMIVVGLQVLGLTLGTYLHDCAAEAIATGAQPAACG